MHALFNHLNFIYFFYLILFKTAAILFMNLILFQASSSCDGTVKVWSIVDGATEKTLNLLTKCNEVGYVIKFRNIIFLLKTWKALIFIYSKN